MAPLRQYETMLLIDSRLDGQQIEAVLDRFSSLVTERGGEIGDIERWGRRRLAYEIKDLQEGFYAIFNYQLDPAQRSGLEEALPFVEGLVRSKTVFAPARTRKVKS
jgi:small subunit ribosomal protein S6